MDLIGKGSSPDKAYRRRRVRIQLANAAENSIACFMMPLEDKYYRMGSNMKK
jgi:hypothetical protein